MKILQFIKRHIMYIIGTVLAGVGLGFILTDTYHDGAVDGYGQGLKDGIDCCTHITDRTIRELEESKNEESK